MGMRRAIAAVVALLADFLVGTEVMAGSSDIRKNLREAPSRVGLTLDDRYRNAVDALVESAARQLPIPASTSGFTYRYDAETGRYERSPGATGGTLFMERPQTLGKGTWSVGASAQYLELDEFDGHKVGKDPDPIITSGGDVVSYNATPKPLYHLFTLNVTYGVTDAFDVNIAVPFAAVDFDTNISRQNAGSTFVSRTALHGHVSVDIADVLLRAKYRLFERDGWAAAAGFISRLPTGDPAHALGTGDAELGPYVALSFPLGDRVEPQFNAGFDVNVTRTNLSSSHYAMGVNVRATSWLDFGGSLLGRSEIDRRRAPTSVSGPHQTAAGPALTAYEGMDLDRKDYFDTSFGFRARLSDHFALTVNAYRAINEDGLRVSQFSPVGALEATF